MSASKFNGNGKPEGEIRIGFYICHCGHNIGGIVDCPAVAEYVRGLQDVVLSRDLWLLLHREARESALS